MNEFLGIGGYTRAPEGFFSWQHLTLVTSMMVVMTLLAVIFGRSHRTGTVQNKNKPLLVAAILIDGFELFKILVCYIRTDDWSFITNNLPLFLCSIQLITIPMAALCKGRLKEAALDFVMIFGVLGAVAGTYGAAQNYGCYPVLSMDNVVSGITHSISGFAALYIAISGMASMRRKNIWITFAILAGFCILAFVANMQLGTNYMFLSQGDGTPYDILYNLVKGSKLLYPMGVIGLFLIYIVGYYGVFYLATHKKAKV